jgi:hypothetical protein
LSGTYAPVQHQGCGEFAAANERCHAAFTQSGGADRTVGGGVVAATAAYVAYVHFEPAGIAGTVPRSVYYAYDAATGTYWAMATFQPSKAALHSKPGNASF